MSAFRLCLPLGEWPEGDRALWEAGTAAGGRRRFSERRYADSLAPASLRKALGGYKHWLGYLAEVGALDEALPPAARVTLERVATWIDAMQARGNADYTVVGRLAELGTALRILVPGETFGWLSKPGGVSVRARLPMRRRAITMHHPKAMMDWGLGMVEQAKTLIGVVRRRVMLRDGAMIALLATRAPRLRSLSELRLGINLRRGEEGWQIDFGELDIKTGKPLAYGLPAKVSAALDRYVEVERVELLGGRIEDALWIGWDGEALRPHGIEKRIRWWSEKRFGKGAAFGPHRFRYGIATIGPMEDPEAAGASAAILGITADVNRAHYDRGKRAAVAGRFQSALTAARDEVATLARNLYAERRRTEEPL